MDVADFVIESTIYEVICGECANRTEQHESAENAAWEAESAGFEVRGDEVLCAECMARDM